jgi:hypothetical protein
MAEEQKINYRLDLVEGRREINVGQANVLGRKTRRPENEIAVYDLNQSRLPTYYKFDDSGNYDKLENKLKYDMIDLNDIPKYNTEDLKFNMFRYNIRENTRSFKPIITNEGKLISFNIHSDVFVDANDFSLNLKITNPNPNNYLQYDLNPIKSITLSNNSEIIEEIFNYSLVEDLENDLNWKQNFYTTQHTYNSSNSNPFCQDTNGLLIPPESLGKTYKF